MGYKNLEHDGNEDFLKDSFPNRKSFDEQLIIDNEKTKEQEEIEKQQKQVAWMNQDNPFLWDGEID